MNGTGMQFFIKGADFTEFGKRADAAYWEAFEPGSQFLLDIIEQPFTCDGKADDREIILNLYVRSEIGVMLGEPDLHVVQPRSSGDFSVEGGRKIGGDHNELAKHFLTCSSGLLKYMKESGNAEEYRMLDPDIEGLKVSFKDDVPEVKRVEGRRRPDLSCVNLFGSVVMGRPYQDEVFSSWGNENMTADELEEAGNEGDEDALDKLAMKYLNGDDEEGIEQNPEKAFYWMKKLAETGNTNGMFNLGMFYAKGFGTARDLNKAAEWMEKAEDAGDEDAEKLLKIYTEMADAYPKAEAGDAEAQATVAKGLMNIAGSLDQAGPGKDYEEALNWAQKSADQNNGQGLWTLALAYEHGRGVPENKRTAVELFQKGADLEDAACMQNLGCYYMSGEIVGKDEKKAFELFRRSAELGNGLAMVNLGRCYQFANGCTGNMKKAVEWYEKALPLVNDPELERKVQVFKMMGDSDPEWDQDYSTSDDEEEMSGPINVSETLRDALKAQGKAHDDEALSNLSIEDAYKLFGSMNTDKEEQEEDEDEEFYNQYIEEKPATRYTRQKELIDQAKLFSSDMYMGGGDGVRYSYNEGTRTICINNIELTHTSSADRCARIERLSYGQELNLRARGEDLIVTDGRGGDIGNISDYLGIGEVISNRDAETVSASVRNVIPKSARGARAKKSIVNVDIELKLKAIDHSNPSSSDYAKSIICFIEGDQTDNWYQKIHVVYSSMPVSEAKKIFEIYNRSRNEYADDCSSTESISLDNFVEEAEAAHKKRCSEKTPGLSYGKLNENDYFVPVLNKAIKKEPSRYESVKSYVSERMLHERWGGFEDLFNYYMVDEETWYWIDETHVSEQEYEKKAEGVWNFSKAAELFEGPSLPVDLSREDSVSVFGTGKFADLVVLSREY